VIDPTLSPGDQRQGEQRHGEQRQCGHSHAEGRQSEQIHGETTTVLFGIAHVLFCLSPLFAEPKHVTPHWWNGGDLL
jgi:hypothetical protein